jgi:uracil phosphoribosyltransferase
MHFGSSSRKTVPLKVSSHPLVADNLRGLRDRSTAPEEFRVLARKIITLLLYEATADLPMTHSKVQTPLTEADAISMDREVVAIPVLRSGLGILGPVLELLPLVSVGYIGLERDEETAVARIYYKKLPKLEGKVPLLLDPMLATGGSAAQALDLIKEAGGRNSRMICVVAAPEGVKVLEERHPEVQIYTAALDQGLNYRAFIVPGLGDFGDRLFGTQT